mmetsp:Transcript_5740/g.14537  ORF Transcript_5740/g.14537 Transcript_5740/m.14537 type:complete len:254 (+) Transcript_5740:367-1128(+)
MLSKRRQWQCSCCMCSFPLHPHFQQIANYRSRRCAGCCESFEVVISYVWSWVPPALCFRVCVVDLEYVVASEAVVASAESCCFRVCCGSRDLQLQSLLWLQSLASTEIPPPPPPSGLRSLAATFLRRSSISAIISCCCLYMSSSRECTSFTFFSIAPTSFFSTRSPMEHRMPSNSGSVSPTPCLAPFTDPSAAICLAVMAPCCSTRFSSSTLTSSSSTPAKETIPSLSTTSSSPEKSESPSPSPPFFVVEDDK